MNRKKHFNTSDLIVEFFWVQRDNIHILDAIFTVQMTISFQYDCLFWRFWGGCLIMQVSTQWKYDFQWRKKIFTYEYLVYQTKQMFYLFHSFDVFFVAQNDFITHELQINILVFAIKLYLNSRLITYSWISKVNHEFVTENLICHLSLFCCAI